MVHVFKQNVQLWQQYSLYYGKKKCLKSIGHADAAYIIQMEITWSLSYVHAQEII